MKKQFVKTYTNQIGDYRLNIPSMTIAEQINKDLTDNNFTLQILQYTENGKVCTVVYEIDEEKSISISDIETMSIDTPMYIDQFRVSNKDKQ